MILSGPSGTDLTQRQLAKMPSNGSVDRSRVAHIVSGFSEFSDLIGAVTSSPIASSVRLTQARESYSRGAEMPVSQVTKRRTVQVIIGVDTHKDQHCGCSPHRFGL